MPFGFKLSHRLARNWRVTRTLYLAAGAAIACEGSAPTDPSYSLNNSSIKPTAVNDLSVMSVTDSSATLSFTEVSDGTGKPASYDLRVARTPFSWSSAAAITRGSCASPLAGTAVGAKRTCTVLGLAAGSGYGFELDAYRVRPNGAKVYGPLSNEVDTVTASPIVVAGTPGTVTNLAVTAVTDTSFTVAFTEVDDGSGHAASYDVRAAVHPLVWWSAASVTRGSCATPVAGSTIGATRTCTILGLAAASTYDVQVVAFSGTLNAGAVFGNLSNVATGTTSSSSGVTGSVPGPKPTDLIIRDTRSAGQNSITGALTLADGLSAAGLYLDWSCQSGNCLPPGFTTAVTPAGEHAFIWNVKQNAGNPDGCIAGGPSQQNWKIWLNAAAVNANGEILLQYRYWSGQTVTGGGAAGNVGTFTHRGGAGGHKDVVWYRQRNGSTTNDGRFTMASEAGTGGIGEKVLWDPVPGEPGTGSNGDIYASTVGVVFDKDAHNNQVVTVTYRLRPESSVGAGDGVFQQWMNGQLVLDLQNQHMGTLGWGEVQIGGPTWICPTQDQTMYIWDIVIWQPR
jgi:hypothetical protein